MTAQALGPITTTLDDVQAHSQMLISPSMILQGHSPESDLRALQLSYPPTVIFDHPRGRQLKPGLAWLARKWLGRTIQDRGPGGHVLKRMRWLVKIYSEQRLKMMRTERESWLMDRRLGPGYGEFRTDYEPILG